jgi:hypothetical protein
MGGTVGIFAATERDMKLPQVQIYPYCAKWLLGGLKPKPGYPPSLWLSGEEDAIATLPETKVCAEKIAAAGNPGTVKLVVLPVKHMFDRYPREPTYSGSGVEASKVEIAAFLKTHGLMK